MLTRNRASGAKAEGEIEASTSLLLRAARAGADRDEWVREAIQELKTEEGVDRVGVWLEERTGAAGTEGRPIVFRGEVWEEGIELGMPEWTRISSDAPLPMERLCAGRSCEYEVEGSNLAPILGPLVELNRVLWVPVLGRRILRGLVMTGTQQRQKALPSARAEKVAEELGLLIELEEERRLAAWRKADLELVQSVNRSASEQRGANLILGQLAESCTRGESLGGAGAVFALIGERRSGLPVAAPSSAPAEEGLVVRAQSGDDAWAHGVNQGPLEALWRQAMESDRVTGAEADRLPLAKDISRLVAIPLKWGKAAAGVLLAGLPRQKGSLEVLERVELRAMLAAKVLEQDWQQEADLRRAVWQKALLELSERPVVLVDAQGFLLSMSLGARELARPGITEIAPDSGTMRFAELFRPRHWEEAQKWVTNRTPRGMRNRNDTFESELSGGKRVVLSRLEVSAEEFSVMEMEEVGNENHGGKIEEAHEALKQALEWLDEGVVVFDESGEILALNARFLQILGFRENETSKLRNLEDVIQCAAKNAAEPELFAAEWRALAANSAEGTQEELAMAKPVSQWIDRSSRAIIGSKGQRLGRVEVYREMTARRMFQSRMVQTEKLASLGQRVTGIVHELSNPLTTILGNAQRLVSREEPDKPTAEVLQILKEAERATGIMRQLLHLSRESRRELRLVSLNELVAQTVELQKVLLAGSGLRLKVEAADALPNVNADFGQLQQVLLNLLQNAQQAMEAAGRGGTLLVRTASGGPGRVRMEVGDDGPGIPQALQARIFDPFFTTKPTGKGTGLGLTIVSGFVRQHGGTVSVHSSPEDGTRFVVELPAAKDLQEAVTREQRARAREMEISPRGAFSEHKDGQEIKEKAPHVLVVEDEATVANLIADVLREEGMRVEVLPDGQRALQAARQESYDLAICDLKMPGMDGQVFYRELVESRNPLSGHILFVTGDVVAQRTQEFLERHHLPHVAKPFRVEELSLAVRRLLSRQSQSAAP